MTKQENSSVDRKHPLRTKEQQTENGIKTYQDYQKGLTNYNPKYLKQSSTPTKSRDSSPTRAHKAPFNPFGTSVSETPGGHVSINISGSPKNGARQNKYQSTVLSGQYD